MSGIGSRWMGRDLRPGEGRTRYAFEPRGRVERRVQRMSTSDLHDWLDVAVMGLGRAASDARRDASSPALVEIEDGAAVVAVVAAELRRRG